MENSGEWEGNGGLDMGEVLTAKEMVEFVHGTSQESQDNCFNRELDEIKTLEWTGSSQERREVESRLQKMFDELSSPRGVMSKQQLSHGTWDLASRTALVTKHLGKHFEFMGTGEGPHIRLVGEEALFLLESGSLNIDLGGVALSVQQAYQLMLEGEDLAIKQYLVYSKLIKSGFKVVRHQGDLGITRYERQIGLDQYQRKDSKIKQVKAPAHSMAPVVGRKVHEAVEEVMVVDEDVSDCDNDELVDMIVEDLISAAVDYCENQIEVVEPLSPKYEPPPHEDAPKKCALCAVIHPGGEEICKARTFPKRCKFCNKLGHQEKIHWEVDPEFRKQILKAVNHNANGDVFTEQMMWGHFADIASDDEEVADIASDDEEAGTSSETVERDKLEKTKAYEESGDEIIELNDSSDDDLYKPDDKVIEADSEEEEIKKKSVLAKYMINPFHSEDPDKELDIIDVDNDKQTTKNNSTENNSKSKLCDKNSGGFNPHKVGYSNTNKDIADFVPNQFCCDGSPKYTIQDSAYKKIEKLKRKICEISASSGAATQYPGLVYAFCELCKVECSSKVVYDSHMVGKKHLKMVIRLSSNEAQRAQVAESRIHDTEVVTVEESGSTKPKNLIELPNGFNKSSLKVKFADLSLLPPGAQPIHRVYHVDLDALRKSQAESVPVPYEQLEAQQTDEPPAKKVNRSFFCEVCRFRLDNSDEEGVLAHISSQKHKINLYDEDDDVIVIDDNEKSDEKRERQIEQCRRKELKRDFRGFWPKARVTRPLAMAEDGDKVNYNFGHYSKPPGGEKKNKGKGFGYRGLSGAKPRTAFKGNKNLDKFKRMRQHRSLLPGWILPERGSNREKSRDHFQAPFNQKNDHFQAPFNHKNNHFQALDHHRDKYPGKRSDTENESPTCIDILDDDDVQVILDDVEEEDRRNASNNDVEEEDRRNASNNVGPLVDELSTGPLSSLWEAGGVTPLLRPEMAGSTEEVMSRIQIFEKEDTNEVMPSNYEEAELRITYDLYLNTTNFRKSMKKLPDFYVMVMDCHDEVPDSGALLKLRKNLCDSVPMLMAVVNAGSVLFFSLSEVDLPDIVSMG